MSQINYFIQRERTTENNKAVSSGDSVDFQIAD